MAPKPWPRARLWSRSTPTSPSTAARPSQDGMLPTNHAEHETLEITQGINDWSEVGFYVFSSIQSDGGWQWVGDHIRPRVRAPEKWHWPVGVSLSTEIGYQRAAFSPDTWTWEIRPIIDKKIGPWYLSFNPALDRSFHGPGVNQGVAFSPNVKVSYDFTKKIAGGLEYYAAYGSLSGFDALRDQQQQFFPVDRHRLRARVGVQFRSRHRHDALHRSPHREMHRWSPLLLAARKNSGQSSRQRLAAARRPLPDRLRIKRQRRWLLRRRASTALNRQRRVAGGGYSTRLSARYRAAKK